MKWNKLVTHLRKSKTLKKELVYFEKVGDEVKLASGDSLDMKNLEPAQDPRLKVKFT